MQRIGQRIIAGDIKLVITYIVQEHIDTAQVIGGNVNLLPIVADTDALRPQNLGSLQQQRARTAGGVIDLVHLFLTHCAEPHQHLRHLAGRVELAAAFACVGRIHGHQELIRITKGIYLVFLELAQLHVTNAVEQLTELFVALGDSSPQLIAVYIKVIEQAGEAGFGNSSFCGFFNVVKHLFQRFV